MADRTEELRHKIAAIPMVGTNPMDDNLAIALCTYFSDHPDRPENDEDTGETGWGDWVEQQYKATLDRIVAVATA
jgi:hypothetical protein